MASEQSEWWLSVHDILHFLPHNDPTQVRFWSKSFLPHKILTPIFCLTVNPQIRFLWASEETGFRHIYLVVARFVVVIIIIIIIIYICCSHATSNHLQRHVNIQCWTNGHGYWLQTN